MSGCDWQKSRFQVGGYRPSDVEICAHCGKEIREGVSYKVRGRRLHQKCYQKESSCGK